METAWIVKVAVSAAPYSIDKPYDYLVPAALEELAVPGARVTVPFGRGNRTSEGIILAAAPERNPGAQGILRYWTGNRCWMPQGSPWRFWDAAEGISARSMRP